MDETGHGSFDEADKTERDPPSIIIDEAAGTASTSPFDATAIERNTTSILAAISDMEVDVRYLQSLKTTMADAESNGVDVAGAIPAIESQITATNGSLRAIGDELTGKLTVLVDLEKRISKFDSAIEVSGTAIDIFRAVHGRLQNDKSTLDGICAQINMWNLEHDVTIDTTSVTGLIGDIDQAYGVFNQEISELAQGARISSSSIRIPADFV